MKIRVIFRACDKVFCSHDVDRPFTHDKRQIIKTCFKSLIAALNGYDYTIDVIGDDLSRDLVNFFSSCENTNVMDLHLGSASASITAALDKGLQYDDEDWIYMCEDDYLHAPHFMQYLSEFIENKNTYFQLTSRKRNRTKWLTGDLTKLPLFIHPSDYPDSYLPRNSYASLLFLSKYCHWRQIQFTTHTFMTQARNLRKYEKYIRESGVRHDDAYLSRRIYGRYWLRGKALCVSPIPGLSAHLTDGVMSPFVDWEPLFKKFDT